MDIRNGRMGLDRQFGLKVGHWRTPGRINRTNAKGLNDPVELLPSIKWQVYLYRCLR